jgi:hypothetical protein
VNVDLTQDQRDIILVALDKYLAEIRREYEDAFDVGANVSGIRERRDLIIQTIEAVKGTER